MQMYIKTWKYRPICFWGARSLRSLAHISYMYMIFISVGTFGGGGLAPQYQKAGYATDLQSDYINIDKSYNFPKSY